MSVPQVGSYRTKYHDITVGQMLNECICDTALAGIWAHFVSKHGSTDPYRFLAVSMICGFAQPTLTYLGFDGIFKRRVNYLSPILATTVGYGIALGTQYAVKTITLSDDARFYTIASAAYLGLIKGLTRIAINRSPYPSLAPLVTVPASGVASLCEGVSSLFSRAINSQFVKSKTDAIYWALNRFKNNPCQDPQKEPKEV